MNSSQLLFITLGLVLLISHAPLHADAARKSKDKVKEGGEAKGIDLIRGVCDGAMEDKASCMQVLTSDPKYASAKNYVDLSKMILEEGLSRTKKGQNFLKQLAVSSKSKAVSECADIHYGGAVGSFFSSLGEIKEDPMTANYDAKRAGDYAEYCENGLATERFVNPQVDNLNKETKLMSFIAFLATNYL